MTISQRLRKAVIAAALLNHHCKGIGIPGRTLAQGRSHAHATGGKVGFERATNGIQLYDVAKLATTSLPFEEGNYLL